MHSFPAAERIEFSKLLESTNRGERLTYAIQDARGIRGFAVLRPLSSGGVYLLEYLAVAEHLRAKGLGSMLLRGIVEDLAQRNGVGIIFEVEPPEDGSPSEKALRMRRMQFYARHGARVIDMASEYRMPNLSGQGSLKMILMWLPLNG